MVRSAPSSGAALIDLTLGQTGPEGPPGPASTEVVRGDLVTIAPGGSGVALVECPADMIATGGGFDLSNRAAVVTSSTPSPAVTGEVPNGWLVTAENDAAFEIGLTAVVVCAP